MLWPNFGHSTTVNVLSTILYTLWESGRVNMIFSQTLAGDENQVMKHFPPPLCDLWLLLFKVVLWPNFGHSTTVNVLSTILYTLWESGRVSMIFSRTLAGDENQVMKHFPSPCVICDSCYSKWCYGQILAIAPQSMYLAPSCIPFGRVGVST